ncbi:head GIN domain-containing protein [uncultured Draconibacterium sp.]|uniref:head GIN domain-containing protein n=1 Tax=uncultured Draconibacterium sp. TaxID=1573823 RepID=UPI003261B132
MKQTVVVFIYLLLLFGLSSCLFSPSIKGNGNVVEQARHLDTFDELKVSRGMNVYITQGNETKVVVIADENLHEVIETTVTDQRLEIKSTSNIRSATENKVLLTVPQLEVIKAIAGCNVYSEGILKGKEMEISAAAGSNVHLSVELANAKVSASAGSNINMDGTANHFFAKAAAGANIKANSVVSNLTEAKVSSGANIWVNSKEELKANASSGGNIFFIGNPPITEFHKSSGGNVIKN